MAETKSIFTKLKALGKDLDRKIPELEEDYKRRGDPDEKEALRTLLLRQLQEDVDSKKKECTALANGVKSGGMQFSQFLQLAKVVTQQQSDRIKELQGHLQKYGYEPPKTTQEAKQPSDGKNAPDKDSSSPKTGENDQGLPSPPKQIHHGPWTLDRTPTLEDFGVHPNFMERVNEMVEKSNRDMQEYYAKYCDDSKPKQVPPPQSEQPVGKSKTPAYFSETMVVVTPGVFDGRFVPDTGGAVLKYFESPPSGSVDPKDGEMQATPHWMGFQRTMMEETPEPLSVQAKRVARATGSTTGNQRAGQPDMTYVTTATPGTQNRPGHSSALNAKPSVNSKALRGLEDSPPTPQIPQMVSEVGKRWVADLLAKESEKDRPKERSIGTPQTPVFLTPGLKFKRGPVQEVTENFPTPQTPVFLTPGLNKTKSLPALTKQLDVDQCLTPETPECLKRFYSNNTMASTTKNNVCPVKSFTTDDVPNEKAPSPEMTFNSRSSPATPKSPELLTNREEVQRLLKNVNLNEQPYTADKRSKMAPFGSHVKVRTGVTPLVPKSSHLPFITPGKENRTLNFTGIQPEFNLIVEPIAIEEYEDLPSYQRRQFTFNTLNKVVEKINALLEDKLANDEPLQLVEEEVVRELGPSAFTLLMIMSCLGRVKKCSVQGKFLYTVL